MGLLCSVGSALWNESLLKVKLCLRVRLRRPSADLTIPGPSYSYAICSDNNKLVQVVSISAKQMLDKLSLDFQIWNRQTKEYYAGVGMPMSEYQLAKVPVFRNKNTSFFICDRQYRGVLKGPGMLANYRCHIMT